MAVKPSVRRRRSPAPLRSLVRLHSSLTRAPRATGPVGRVGRARAVRTLPARRVQTRQLAKQNRVAVHVLAYCGLRWSELAALRVGRIDLTRRTINVAEAVTEVNGGRVVWGTPKTHEARTVPLPRFLAAELSTLIAGRSAEELVFTSTRGQVLRNRNARRGWFDAAAAQIGEAGLTARASTHGRKPRSVGRRNVKAVQENARPRLRSDGPGYVCGPVRRRSQRCGGEARRRRSEGWRCLHVA